MLVDGGVDAISYPRPSVPLINRHRCGQTRFECRWFPNRWSQCVKLTIEEDETG